MNTNISAQWRGLTPAFMEALTNGALRPLLERVWADKTLELAIRKDYINVYYRGGNLLRVEERSPERFTARFDPKYLSPEKHARISWPASLISRASDADSWVGLFPTLKDSMDLWFGRHGRDERACQQLAIWENNRSPWAGGTDYFIVDIEYANRQGARFDLVALRWDSTAAARSLRGANRPQLTLIEMKAGDAAIAGKSGLQAHLSAISRFLEDRDRMASFKAEMLHVFKQKRELRLIESLRKNPHAICEVEEQIEVALLLVGHDEASSKLSTALSRASTPSIPVHRFTANFAGFGLYAANRQQL